MYIARQCVYAVVADTSNQQRIDLRSSVAVDCRQKRVWRHWRGNIRELAPRVLFIPPGTVVSGAVMFYCWCFYLFISPCDFRAPSVDRWCALQYKCQSSVANPQKICDKSLGSPLSRPSFWVFLVMCGERNEFAIRQRLARTFHVPIPFQQKNQWESPQNPHTHRTPKFSIPHSCVFSWRYMRIFAVCHVLSAVQYSTAYVWKL